MRFPLHPVKVIIGIAMSLTSRTEWLDQMLGIDLAIQLQNKMISYVSLYLILKGVHIFYCFCTLQFRRTLEGMALFSLFCHLIPKLPKYFSLRLFIF